MYFILIHLYYLGLIIAAPFYPKARRWIMGRLDWRKRMKRFQSGKGNTIWFHAASLGEFEQGRPVMEALRLQHPGIRILLTFFSPSGYEIRKNYPGADQVEYLPLDTPYNANQFIKLAKPKLAVFIKYEFWFGYLNALHRQAVPVWLISAAFRAGQPFFSRYGKWHRQQLQPISCIFVQNEKSAELLNQIGISQVILAGDTRFDRVMTVKSTPYTDPRISAFVAGHFCLIAGSSWPADETLLAGLIRSASHDDRFIIAPHEVSRSTISSLCSRLDCECLLYSSAGNAPLNNARVMIIDSVGQLSYIYRFGNLAYVGGGFGKGLHNILEAAVYGIPVVFGPRQQKHHEAAGLIAAGGAFVVDSAEELTKVYNQLRHSPQLLALAGNQAAAYVKEQGGATETILYHINNFIANWQ